MAKIKKFFEKRFLHIFKVIIMLTTIYYIWHSDNIRKNTSPKKYWIEKEKNLQKAVLVDKLKIQSLMVDLEKEVQNCSFEIEKSKLEANILEKDETQAVECANINHRKKIESIHQSIEEMKKVYLKDRKDLEKAISKLDEINKIKN
jgi:hypothetical protein